MTEIAPNEVFVTSSELDKFASQWPCSGMRFDNDLAVKFSFDGHGNLVDIAWFDAEYGCDITEPTGVDGAALLALSQDAGEWLNAQHSE